MKNSKTSYQVSNERHNDDFFLPGWSEPFVSTQTNTIKGLCRKSHIINIRTGKSHGFVYKCEETGQIETASGRTDLKYFGLNDNGEQLKPIVNPEGEDVMVAITTEGERRAVPHIFTWINTKPGYLIPNVTNLANISQFEKWVVTSKGVLYGSNQTVGFSDGEEIVQIVICEGRVVVAPTEWSTKL